MSWGLTWLCWRYQCRDVLASRLHKSAFFVLEIARKNENWRENAKSRWMFDGCWWPEPHVWVITRLSGLNSGNTLERVHFMAKSWNSNPNKHKCVMDASTRPRQMMKVKWLYDSKCPSHRTINTKTKQKKNTQNNTLSSLRGSRRGSKQHENKHKQFK